MTKSFVVQTDGRRVWYRCQYVRGYGPYWYAFWSTKTGDPAKPYKRHSKYIGKKLPEELQAYADAVQALQAKTEEKNP